MPTAAPPIPDSLRPEVCPNCAYSLAGLPDPITCPECGRIIDPNEIIFYGWARGKHENLGNARRGRLPRVFLFSLLLLILLISQFALRIPLKRWSYSFPVVLLVGAAALTILLQMVRRVEADHPAPIQVRLTQHGCVQFDSMQGPSTFLQLWLTWGWLVPLLLVAGLAAAYVLHRIHASSFAIVSLYVLFLGVPPALRARRFRRAIKSIPDRAITDANAYLFGPLPWKSLGGYTLEPQTLERYRLRIRRRGFWTLNPYPIDAEILCSHQQADFLRDWLQTHIAASRA